MTYQRWFDEGTVVLDAVSVDATCPDWCPFGGTCELCGRLTCPEHGVPVNGEPVSDTHVSNMCVRVAHATCHGAACRDADCWF